MARRILVAASVLALAMVPLVAPVGAVPELVRHAMPLVPAPGAATPPVGALPGPAAGPLLYHGGPIQKVPSVYLVFWGWLPPEVPFSALPAPVRNLANNQDLDSDPSGEAAYLQAFFGGVGGSSWANIKTQYDDPTHGAITNPPGQLKGVWYDDDPLSIEALLESPDFYIGQEADNAAAHFGGGADAQYIIATPHGHNTQGFGSSYCAWHSNTGTTAFTNLPYITDAGGSCGANFVNSGEAGKLDGVSIVAGHEYTETVTDPHLNAWYDANGLENADKCIWLHSGPGASQNIVLSTGTFAVQGDWSNANGGCVIGYP